MARLGKGDILYRVRRTNDLDAVRENKDILRSQLAAHVEEFEKRGGKIETCGLMVRSSPIQKDDFRKGRQILAKRRAAQKAAKEAQGVRENDDDLETDTEEE